MSQPDMSVTQDRIDANWSAITVELDAPRPGRVERLLGRIGVPTWTARLLVATPALRRSWYLAIGVVIIVGLGSFDAAEPRDGLFALLFLAPMLPVLGVSMAYGPDADPAHEITMATPIRGLRLVVVRSAAVIAVSMMILGLGTLLAPEPSLLAFGWLLPSFACTGATLAAMTVTSPRRAALGTVVTWMLLVLVVRRAAEDPLAAFTAVGQAVAVVVMLVAALVVWLRRSRFDTLAVA